MKQLSILHLGMGNVGKEVKEQIDQQRNMVKKDFGVDLVYQHTFTSKNSEQEIMSTIDQVDIPFVLIDTTASDKTTQYLLSGLKRGGFAVLANKKPLAGKQKDFDILHKSGKQRLFYECVVGAGLPVIQAIKNLIDTGDEIIEIQGCFSGTLGFLFSQLDEGKSFSQAVILAKQKGFTEPDPRDDLSGLDVARKALILSRLLGKKLDREDIQLTGLFPKKMEGMSVDAFLKSVDTLDDAYQKQIERAKKKNKVLRFVAKVNQKQCNIGLQEVDKSSDIGALTGPDNIIVIKSRRYFDNPLIIKGPGAGIQVTAAGVFADVLSIARIVEGGSL